MTPPSAPFAAAYFGQAPEDLGDVAAAVRPSTWGPPLLFYGIARSLREPSLRYLAMSGEQPCESLGGGMPKAELEQRHLDRFCADYALATGRSRWDVCLQAAPGADPPDFTCRGTEGITRLECVQFTVSERRAVQALTRRFKARILASDLSRLGRLRGHLVYLWFWDPVAGRIRRPPGAWTDQEVLGLVDALAAYEPQRSPGVPAEGPLPDSITLELASADQGAVFYAVPFAGGHPDTRSFHACGFEIGYVYPNWHDNLGAHAALIDLVRNKDRGANQELLVSVGAPDQNGVWYPSDEVLFRFALDSGGLRGYSPTHLERVTAHAWSTGAIYELHPESKLVFAGVPES